MPNGFDSSFPVPTLIDVSMIAPILVVMITGILALIVEILRPKQNNNAIVLSSLAGLLVAGYLTVTQFQAPEAATLVDMVVRDRFGLVIQLLLIGSCFLTILFSEGYLRQKSIPYGEFYPLILWSTSGAMLMATSKNLLVIFLGLEILSISLYVLAGMSRRETRSEESALKYFLLGAFASGFLLYGIAFFYGATGSLDLGSFNNALTGNGQAKTTILFGLGLMFVGLGFKSAFAPFHQWAPDVYQGAPTNVSAFMAVCSKIGAIAALFRVMLAASPIKESWMPAMIVVAMLTMIIGNAVALLQKDIKRILGYSSIAHAGYILVGLLAYVNAPDRVTTGAVMYYLLAYSFMTIGSFAVLTISTKDGKDFTKLEDLRGLWQRSPWTAITLVTFMVSLIGIPPTAGFMGKLGIFQDALNAELGPLAITMAVASVISVAYYLAVAWSAFVSDDPQTGPKVKSGFGVAATCAVCLIGVVVAGVFADPVRNWFESTTPSGPIVVRR